MRKDWDHEWRHVTLYLERERERRQVERERKGRETERTRGKEEEIRKESDTYSTVLKQYINLLEDERIGTCHAL